MMAIRRGPASSSISNLSSKRTPLSLTYRGALIAHGVESIAGDDDGGEVDDEEMEREEDAVVEEDLIYNPAS